jgi:hypothetical protein
MSDDQESVVIERLAEAPLDVDWDREGAEWEHFLHRRLIERLGNTNMFNQRRGPPGDPYVYFDFQVTHPPLTAYLRIVPGTRGAQALLVGQGEIDGEHRELWLDAVRTATDRVGSDHHEFHWFTLITSEPVLGQERQVLQEGGQVGGLHIRPSGVIYWEDKPYKVSLDGVSVTSCMPVIVEGDDRGFNFDSASTVASRRVACLCSILSVMLDSRWTIKQSPHNRKVRVPTIGPRTSPPEHPEQMMAHDTVSLPDGLAEAWDRVGHDQVLANALAVYQQGLDVCEDHPSLALVAFVAAVEGVGARYEELVRCEKCGAQIGARRRFTAALSVIRSKADAAPLIAAYGPRSETVHEGVLHGSEAAAGAFSFGITQVDPILEFESGLVEDLRDAARDVLYLALKGELPDRRRW